MKDKNYERLRGLLGVMFAILIGGGLLVIATFVLFKSE